MCVCVLDSSLSEPVRSQPCEIITAVSTNHMAAVSSNPWLPDVSDYHVKDECGTSAEVCSVKEPQPECRDPTLERKSSGTEASWLPDDDSVALHNDSGSRIETNEVVDWNKSSDAGKVMKDSRSQTLEGANVSENDDAGWSTAAREVYGEDRCISCRKPRPLEQCPVCHCMYSSVAIHIGVHSMRKIHTPSALLRLEQPTHETADSGLAGDQAAGEGPSRCSDQSYMCTACGEFLPSAKTLRSHVNSKSCLKFAICMVCGTTCENEAGLRSHMKQLHAHSDVIDDRDAVPAKKKCEDFSCALCKVEFGNADLLSQHMEEHIDKEQRVCLVCEKTFMRLDSLQSHMRCHTGKMPFQCEICGKSCRTRRDLKEHRYVHSSEKPYVCADCGKRFRLKKTYIRHRVTHSGEKNYECEFCGMRFSFNYRRTRHMLVHTGEKPYVCSTCGERFTQWNGLSQHRLRSCRK